LDICHYSEVGPIDYFSFLKFWQTIPFEFLHHLNPGWRFLL